MLLNFSQFSTLRANFPNSKDFTPPNSQNAEKEHCNFKLEETNMAFFF